MRIYPVTDFLETEICFLAEVDIRGTIYRFSSFPIEIDLDGGGIVFFPGLLSDPDFSQEILEVGQIKLSSNSMSMALVFPFNVAARQMLGTGIDNARVNLSYVTVKRGQVEQTYQEIIDFFQGIIREPVYGHPDADPGYVEFTIENEIYVNDTSLLKAINGDLIVFDNFPFSTGQFQGAGDILNIETEYITNQVKFSLGKTVPAIIGAPGETTLINGDSLEYAATPAYKIGTYIDIPNPTIFFLLIAGHYCTATTVTLQDNDGNLVSSKAVYNSTGASGQVYAYAIFDQNELSFTNLVDDRQYEYYVRWTGGGGAVSPYTGGQLSRGGDLIAWSLESLKIDFDRSAFEAVRPILNEYKFAGYINDSGIKIYEFLQKYIIPFLPVTLTTGAGGIYPVIDHRNTELFLSPRISIETNATFERISPVTPRQSEIINDLLVKYASGFESTTKFNANVFGGSFGAYESVGGTEYKGMIYIRAKRQEGIETPYEVVSPYCIISQQRYGVQSSTIEIDYVHDRDTAIKIGLDIIRRKSLPEKVCTYRAAFSFGYLSIGDVIELTDSDIGLSQSRVQIVGKRYDGASWLYDIMFQENPIDNVRDAI